MTASNETETANQVRLRDAYQNFNLRNIDLVLQSLHPNVEWANGMEGGHVHGREAVRAYWTRQWQSLDPHVEPLKMESAEDQSIVVKVHQVVRDKSGEVLIDTVVRHAYRFEDGLIVRMDILNSGPDKDETDRAWTSQSQ